MKIKIFPPIILSAVIFGPICHADINKVQGVSVKSLQTTDVIGKIGVPLGQVAQITAVIVDGDTFKTKGDSGRFLLKITQVNSKPLGKPVVMNFGSMPFHDVNLANNDFKLYELKHGQKPKSLDTEQVTELKKGYVGRIVKLMVYETGEFTGIPKNLPEDVLIWQDTSFGFSSYLYVIKMLDN